MKSSEKDYEWLVRRRNDTQLLLLSHYNFLKKHRNALLAGEELHRSIFGLLIGAAFSLWRSVFLAEAERGWEKILEQAEKFLKTVIEDNAINYTQDKTMRDWSVGYYLNNARYRVDRILSKLPDCKTKDNTAFVEFRKIKQTGIDQPDHDPTKAWDAVFEAVKALFELLEHRIQSSS